MNKTIKTLLATLTLACTLSLNAGIKLPAIISSNMILQRNTTVQLWGWADPNEKIKIKTSWTKKPINISANDEGLWKISLATTNSKATQTINLKSKSSDIKLNNILFGEVWVCSGQSNMEHPLEGFFNQPVYEANMTIAQSNNNNIRLFTVEKFGSKTKLNDIEKYSAWEVSSPESAAKFSAVAYFYGKQLQEILDVPVGLIHTSWGASTIEAWMSEEVLSSYQKVDLSKVDITRETNTTATALFNAMMNPLIPFTIKGAIWYQAESNRFEYKEYKKLFPAMVKDWRERWNIGDFPFYYVQIAPFVYWSGRNNPDPTKNSANIRYVQLQCTDLIPNSGIAITMDIGGEYYIHPPKKKETANRLVLNALNKTYGFKAVDCEGPRYDSKETKENAIILKFKHAENGLFAKDGLSGFEISADDRVFYPANAHIIDNSQVKVFSDKVPNPVAVRYCWSNWAVGTLYDTHNLPASSFKTDDWDNATKYQK